MSLLKPGQDGLYFLCAVTALSNFGAASYAIFSPSILSDIIDYGTWKFGQNHAGIYFSLYSLATKATVAIGGAFALGIAGWYGFDPSESDHSEQAVSGLRLGAIYLPAILGFTSLILIYLIPMSAGRHAVICKALARRESRKR